MSPGSAGYLVPSSTGCGGRILAIVPLQSYVIAQMGPAAWVALQPWHGALSVTDDLRLIQRNIDRECDRSDITPLVWRDFLLDIAATHGGADACETIDRVMGKRRSYFTLAGKFVNGLQPEQRLHRFMRLDHVLKYMLSPLPIVVGNLNALATAVTSGAITGSHLEGKTFGRPDHPTWSTLSSLPGWRASADRARDRFGLKHIDAGHLVEMRYPVRVLTDVCVAVKSPTVLDSWSGGASNWIFAKRRGLGGPDAGYTVDMDGGGACARGSTELVHAHFVVPTGAGALIDMQVHGRLSRSSPVIDFGALRLNPAI